MNNQIFFSYTKESGFTLIELMIAMTISLFLMAGIIEVFIGSKQTYRVQNSISEIQASARFALHTLGKEVRMAGYMGCGNVNNLQINNNLNAGETSFAYNFAEDLVGFEANGTAPGQTYSVSNTYYPNSVSLGSSSSWTPALNTGNGLVGNIIPGTDIIAVRYMSPYSSSIVNEDNDDNAYFFADNVDGSGLINKSEYSLVIGGVYIVSDCAKASISQITDKDSITYNSGAYDGYKLQHSDDGSYTPGNINSDWSSVEHYKSGAEVGRAITTIFYVGRRTPIGSASSSQCNGSRIVSEACPAPGLFRKTLRIVSGTDAVMGVAEELVENVENMQIVYGEDTDTDGTVNRYVPAGTAGLDMDRVLSVRISLLIRSPDQVRNDFDSSTYLLPDIGVEGAATKIDLFNDKHIRHVFTTTINLRNHSI